MGVAMVVPPTTVAAPVMLTVWMSPARIGAILKPTSVRRAQGNSLWTRSNCTVSPAGCTSEGVVVTLLGVEYGPYVDGIPCTTGVLDHKGSVDFAGASTEFNGRVGGQEDDHEREMMGSCYKMGLNYVIHDGGNVTWVGDGSWEPRGEICVDWEDKNYYVWTCNLTGSGPVWQMEGCKMNKGVMECPP